jgi:hypothetical protein
MKNLMVGLLLAGMTTLLAAQENVPAASPDNIDKPSNGQPALRSDYRARNSQSFSTMVAYGSFSVGGEERFGPMMIVQYSPRISSGPSIDFSGGILFRTGSSVPENEGDYVPLASFYTPYYSPYSNHRNDNYYRMPNLNIGMGFLGADVTFYMTEGQVRPYLGFGGALALWTYSGRLSGTVAPEAKAGMNIHLNNSLSGFAEVRRMFGVPNLLNLSGPKFDGLTSVALGVTFAPRLRP